MCADCDDPKKPKPAPGPTTVAVPCPGCDIEIIDEMGAVVTGIPERMVGQWIQLKVRSTPTVQPLMNPLWDISGVIVKEYVQKNRAAYKSDHRAEDSRVDFVKFYWLDGSFTGEGKTVTVSATVLGVRKTKSVTFMLFKPQVDQFDIIAQATHVTTEYGTSNSPSLTNYHRNPSGHEGSDWNVQATLPSPAAVKADGEIAFVQLINVNGCSSQVAPVKERVSTRSMLLRA